MRQHIWEDHYKWAQGGVTWAHRGIDGSNERLHVYNRLVLREKKNYIIAYL